MNAETFAQSSNGVINDIIGRLTKAINQVGNDATIRMVLAAYNRYQEDERDGVDYIFNLEDKDDLKTLIEGGYTASDIAWAYGKGKETNLFLFHAGANYDHMNHVGSISDLKRLLTAYLENIVPCVFLYPWVDEYKAIWTMFVTESVENSQFLHDEIMGVH